MSTTAAGKLLSTLADEIGLSEDKGAIVQKFVVDRGYHSVSALRSLVLQDETAWEKSGMPFLLNLKLNEYFADGNDESRDETECNANDVKRAGNVSVYQNRSLSFRAAMVVNIEVFVRFAGDAVIRIDTHFDKEKMRDRPLVYLADVLSIVCLD